MAYYLNGSNHSYLSSSTALVTAAPYTLACFTYGDDTAQIKNLIAITDGTLNNRIHLDLQTDETARFFSRDGSNATISGFSTIVSGYYHICGVCRAANDRELYVNGVSEGTNTSSNTPSGLSNTFVGTVPTAYNTDVHIAEAAIWDTDLTIAEIQALSDGYSPLLICPDSLVYYLPLVRNHIDRISGQTWIDAGTATVAPHPRIIYPAPPRWISVPPAAGGGTAYEFAATISPASATPDASSLAVARPLAAAIGAGSATPDTVSLSIARAFAAAPTGATATPDTSSLSVLRALAVTVTAATNTPDIDLWLAIALTAVLTGSSSTPDDVSLAVLHELLAAITAGSSTPDDAELTIPGSGVQFAATILAGSATPDSASLAVARALSAQIDVGSATPDDASLAVLRELTAVIAAGSATPDDISLLNAIALAAQVQADTSTPDDVSLAVARALSVTAEAGSNTPIDANLALARALSAVISVRSNTPDTATLLVTFIAGLVSGAFTISQPTVEYEISQPEVSFTVEGE